MTKSTIKIALALFAMGLFASGAYAAPVSLSDAQMDSVAAGGADTTDGFVCPVISTDAVLNSALGAGPIAEGDYTIIGPDISVPLLATNDDGAGSPGGSYVSPGEDGYTAIWAN